MRREVRFLDSLQGRGIRPGLTRLREFLRASGAPQHSVPSVIVAGTNGKGSTAATLASIVQKGGYRVGFYSSPHLVSLLERWRIGAEDVDEAGFVDAVRWLRHQLDVTAVELTYFEALTALAFRIFAEARCELAVLEVGMGGRLDATNVTRPLSALITPIGLDHTEYLGRTLRAIAREKAGVIHRGSAVWTSNRDPAVLEVLRRRCDGFGVRLHRSSREAVAGQITEEGDRLQFDLRMKGEAYALSSPLTGLHQVGNISLAVCGARSLMGNYPRIDRAAVERGVASTRWRGRLEKFRLQGKVVMVDGAHNEHAARVLADHLLHDSSGRRRTLIFAVMKDKDYAPIVALLAPLFDDVYTTSVDRQRGADARALAALFSMHGVRAKPMRNAAAALSAALDSPAEMIMVAGSLYLAGEAIRLLDQHAGA